MSTFYGQIIHQIIHQVSYLERGELQETGFIDENGTVLIPNEKTLYLDIVNGAIYIYIEQEYRSLIQLSASANNGILTISI